MSETRKLILFLIFGIVLGSLLSAPLSQYIYGIQVAQSSTGKTNTESLDWIETKYANFTHLYIQDVNVTDVLAYPEQFASYVVFKVGSTTYAKSGTTGQIDFSGANSASIINSALSSQGLVLLKDANYTISTVIQVRDNTDLMGEGKNTILFAANGLDDSVIENYDHTGGNHDFTVSNLRIDGNKEGQSKTLTDKVNGITITYCYNWEFRNLWIQNTQEQGLRVGAGCYDGLIEDFDIRDCNWTGLGITYYNHAVELTSDRPHDIRVLNGYIENCEEFSVDLEGEDRVDVINVWSVNAPDTGLQLYQTTWSRFMDCKVINSTKWGIRAYTSPQCMIVNNQIDQYDTGNTGNYDGIYTYNSDRTQVVGNYVKSDHGRASVNIEGGSWTLVASNWLEGYPMSAIIDTGTATKIEANYGYP